jgi:ATP-binding cassette subfamily B protein
VKDRGAHVVRALRLIRAASGGWTFAWLLLLVVRGVLPAAVVYLTKYVVDAFAAAIGGGLAWASIQPLVLPTVLMGGALLLQQVLGSVLNWIKTAQSENIQDHIKTRVHRKAAEVDLAFYERPNAYDRLSRATGQASSKSLSLLNNIGGILQNVITLFAIAGILVPYGLWLPVLLLLSTLPALWVVVRHNLLEHDWWQRTTEDRRWANYYDRVQTLPYYAGEIRILGLNEHFRDAYRALRARLRGEKIQLLRNKSVAQFGAGISALVVMTGAIGWMGMRALQGAATLGDVALFYQAFNRGQGFMRSLLSSTGSLYTDARYLEHLFGFLDETATVTNPPSPVVPSDEPAMIAFRDVSFKYPRSEAYALHDFSLEIPDRQTVAIVGPNGAGKSTFTKLLCRFYDPTEGQIEVDGVDLREMDLDAHRERITIMFQHPIRYMATAKENIHMGEIDAPLDTDRLRRAAAGAKARPIIEKLPDGYDTLLGKHFKGGVELSGGEWQRISLARAFYREAPIVVLDEPTSHMDSWAEADWLERFYRMVEDKTALIITHRFTTAKRADIIYVMDDGAIIESGSHDELLAQEGHYAASWRAQIESGPSPLPPSAPAEPTPAPVDS